MTHFSMYNDIIEVSRIYTDILEMSELLDIFVFYQTDKIFALHNNIAHKFS